MKSTLFQKHLIQIIVTFNVNSIQIKIRTISTNDLLISRLKSMKKKPYLSKI
jgi:hypothetical protein